MTAMFVPQSEPRNSEELFHIDESHDEVPSTDVLVPSDEPVSDDGDVSPNPFRALMEVDLDSAFRVLDADGTGEDGSDPMYDDSHVRIPRGGHLGFTDFVSERSYELALERWEAGLYDASGGDDESWKDSDSRTVHVSMNKRDFLAEARDEPETARAMRQVRSRRRLDIERGSKLYDTRLVPAAKRSVLGY